jgi:signal transduction histidine kinase
MELPNNYKVIDILLESEERTIVRAEKDGEIFILKASSKQTSSERVKESSQTSLAVLNFRYDLYTANKHWSIYENTSGELLQSHLGSLDFQQSFDILGQLFSLAKVMLTCAKPASLLTPDNLMVDGDKVHLIDEFDSHIIAHNYTYLPPEFILTRSFKTTEQEFVYSLSAIAFYLFFNEPHYCYTESDNIVSLLNSEKSAINRYANSSENQALYTVLATALSLNPDMRFQRLGLFKYEFSVLKDHFLTTGDFSGRLINVDLKQGVFQTPSASFNKESLIDKVKTIIRNKPANIIELEGELGVGKEFLIKQLLQNHLYDNWLPIEVESFSGRQFGLVINLIQSYLKKIKSTYKRQYQKIAQGLNNDLDSPFFCVLETAEINYKNFLIETNQNNFKFITVKAMGSIQSLLFTILKDKACCFILRNPIVDEESANILAKIIRSDSKLLIFISQDSQRSNQLRAYSKAVRVAPLTLIDTQQYLAQALSNSCADLVQLSQIVQSKTNGYPKLIIEFLREIQHKEYLCFDDETHNWIVANDKLVDFETPASVIDYYYANYLKIAQSDRRNVQVASCFERAFEVELYYDVLKQLSEDVTDNKALQQLTEFLVYIKERARYMFSSNELKLKIRATVNLQSQAVIHYSIASSMINLKLNEHFYILHKHLKCAIKLLTQEDVNRFLPIINYVANEHFFKTEYASALKNYMLIYQFDSMYEIDKSLFKELLFKICKCFCESAQQEDFYHYFNKYVALNLNDTELVKALLLETQLYIAAGNHKKAMENTDRCLSLVGFDNVDLLMDDDIEDIIDDLQELYSIDDLRNIEYIDNSLSTQEQSQSKVYAVKNILSIVLDSLLDHDPHKLAGLSSGLIQLMFESKEFIKLPAILTSFGLVAIRYTPFTEFGSQLGELGYNLSLKNGKDSHAYRTVAHYCESIRHFKLPISSSLQLLRDSALNARKQGDNESAAINLEVYCINSFVGGENLEVSANRIEWALVELQKMGDITVKARVCLLADIVEAFIQGQDSKDHSCFRETSLSKIPSESDLQGYQKITSYQVIGQYVLNATGDYNLEVEEDAARTTLQILQDFFYCLYQLEDFMTIRDYYSSDLAELIAAFKSYAKLAPHNYEAKYLTLEYKLALLKQDNLAAWKYLSGAISAAEKYNNNFDSAVMCEYAHQFWLEEDDAVLAAHFLSNCKQAYLHWGSQYKVKQFDEKHSDLVSTYTQSNTICSLDKNTLIAVHEVMSKEQDIAATAEGLLRVLMSASNADALCLITKDDQEQEFVYRLSANASAVINFEGPTPLSELSVDDIEQSVFQQISETRTSLLSEDVTADITLSDDPYLQTQSVKSLAAVPFFNKGAYKGLISLSTTKYRYLFSEQHIELLTLLVSQVSFSIENAKMYSQLKAHTHNLELEVQKRTAELNETIATLTHTQEELVESQKLSALGALVNGIAHEINTPLGISITALSLINEALKQIEQEISSQELTQASLETHLESSLSSYQLLEGNLHKIDQLIIKFKQIAIAKTDNSRQLFMLRDCINVLLQRVVNSEEAVNVKFEVNIDEGIEFYGFLEEFVMIVEQLLQNSFQHAFDNSDNQVITISATSNEAGLYFDYQDNGAGISKQQASQIFEPFFTTGRNKGSVGLGLNLIFNLITHLFEGHLKLAPSQKGMHFQLFFPSGLELDMQKAQ